MYHTQKQQYQELQDFISMKKKVSDDSYWPHIRQNHNTSISKFIDEVIGD